MVECVDRLMDDEQKKGWISNMDGGIDRWMVNRWVEDWMNDQMAGWLIGLIDGQTDGMNR